MDERTQQNGGAAASDAVAGRAAAATAGRGGAGGRGGGAGQVHQEFQILLKIEDSGLFEDTGEHGDIVVNLLLLYKSGDVLQHIQWELGHFGYHPALVVLSRWEADEKEKDLRVTICVQMGVPDSSYGAFCEISPPIC